MAARSTATIAPAAGGAILYQPGTTQIRNSTFTANRSYSSSGAIQCSQPASGTSMIFNCTFYSNSTVNSAYGGAMRSDGGTVTVHSCVFYTNRAALAAYYHDLHSQVGIIYATNSLFQRTNGVEAGNPTNGCLVGLDPLLGELAFNGGPTKTHALLTSSPCIDAGSNVAGLETDQRGPGFAREFNGAADIGAYEFGAGPTTVTYSAATFHEVAANDGSIDTNTPIELALFNTSFTGTDGDDLYAAGRLAVSNMPAGLTAVVTRVSSTLARAIVVGHASPHTSASDVTNLTFAFLDTAFSTSPLSQIQGAFREDLKIEFLDTTVNPLLTYSGSAFAEATPNNGTIDNSIPIGIELTYDTFDATNDEDLVASGKVDVDNLPAGLQAVISRTDATHASVILAGAATAHNGSNNVSTVTFSFQDSAFTDHSAAVVTNAVKSDISVSFTDPWLTYSGGTFTELWLNDGSIDNSAPIAITLNGETFTGAAGENFVAAGKLTVTNLPAGLAAIATRTNDTMLVVTIASNAVSHANADDVANLAFQFESGAFAAAAADAVTNALRDDLVVDFRTQSPSNWYVSTTTGNDATGDGSAGNPWATIVRGVAGAQSAANDVIHVAAGTYNESNIVVGKIVTIDGAGMNTTIAQAHELPDTADHKYVFSFSQHGVLRDMTVRHARMTNSYVGCAVSFGGGYQGIVERCRITKNSGYGASSYSGGAVGVGGNSGGRLSVSNSEITDNTASNNGPAGLLTYNATIVVSNCLIANNRSVSHGGAIHTDGAWHGPIEVYDSTIVSNSSEASSGGISCGGRLIMERSLVAWNSATNNAGGIGLGVGSARIVNSTIYGNTSEAADGGANGGGGIYAYANGYAVDIYNCTLFSNRAVNARGGGLNNVYGNTRLVSTIVAGNTAGSGLGPDVYKGNNDVIDSYSLIGDNANSGIIATGAPNANLSYVGDTAFPVDPLLLPLANNGGDELTCALDFNSVARDHGTNELELPTDARGTDFPRVYGAAIDIGAFEYGAQAPRRGMYILLR